MKVQPISNSYRNVNTNNTNRRDVNFGWFGGPMEQNIASKSSKIKDFKNTLFAIKLTLKDTIDTIFSGLFRSKNTH